MLLHESGLDPGIVAERGTFTAWRGRDVPQEHGWLPSKPGLVFPIHTLDGGGIFHRLRPNNPGRFPKYMQPKGYPNRLDVHPCQHERIKRPGGMRYITEGEKKVDAGVSRDLLMVGLSGVWNGQKDKELIPDWDLLPLAGENYSICFDSDITENPMVQLAADRQARLLRERGGEVFITLLPPAPDGSKQGLDDFFSTGGTVKELEMMTRPYEADLVTKVRLSQDEKLRAAIGYLRRDWLERDWIRFEGKADKGNWARGHTARDVKEALIEIGVCEGKLDGRGLVFEAGLRRIADKAAKTAPSVSNAIKHLEADGQLDILPPADNGKARRYRLLVPSATLYSMERDTTRESLSGESSSRCKGLRAPAAPRLRWSSPGRQRRREFEVVKGTSRVRHTGQTPRDALAEDLEATTYVKRLGPHRGAVLDVLEAAGGEMHLEDLCEALHRSRPRDVRRRILKPLEEAEIIECEGDAIRLAGEWLDRLEEERGRKGEIEQAERQAREHREQSKRYREHLEREKRGAPAASHAAVRRTEDLRERRLREIREEEERDRAPTPSAVEALVSRILGQHDRVRMGLLCEIARDEGLRWRDVPPAVRRMGYHVERLPEYDNAEFVFARWKAA